MFWHYSEQLQIVYKIYQTHQAVCLKGHISLAAVGLTLAIKNKRRTGVIDVNVWKPPRVVRCRIIIQYAVWNVLWTLNWYERDFASTLCIFMLQFAPFPLRAARVCRINAQLRQLKCKINGRLHANWIARGALASFLCEHTHRNVLPERHETCLHVALHERNNF